MLEVYNIEGMVRFICCEVCLNVILQPLVPAGVERLYNNSNVCKITYFEFKYYQVYVINDEIILLRNAKMFSFSTICILKSSCMNVRAVWNPVA